MSEARQCEGIVMRSQSLFDRGLTCGCIGNISVRLADGCVHSLDPANVLPPLTAYYMMRVGVLPLIPDFPPGDVNLAQAVAKMTSKHRAVLLANHGPVVAGTSLRDAVYATEELEETAKLFLILRAIKTRPLTTEKVDDLRRRFPVKI